MCSVRGTDAFGEKMKLRKSVLEPKHFRWSMTDRVQELLDNDSISCELEGERDDCYDAGGTAERIHTRT
ncbi:hypothetical protein PG991_003713 [Apiospora marii]|uniref:Uncharacterized protein n=1 Tax=Apiospora marii TaxID=335849 RepID=A0ABR1S492_9PEZI